MAAAATAPVPTQESLGTPGAFDIALCTRLFAECSAAAHDVPVLPFLTACEEVKKVVASLDKHVKVLPSERAMSQAALEPEFMAPCRTMGLV